MLNKMIILFVLCCYLPIYCDDNQNMVNIGHPVPCLPSYQGFYNTYDYPLLFPQYVSDMPFETLIGYVVSDSICKYGSLKLYTEFINRQLYNSDTLKYIERSFYSMKDYNPLMLKAYDYCSRNGEIRPFLISNKLQEKFSTLYFNSNKIRLALLLSDIIAHVKVVSTESKFNPNALLAKNQINVKSTVLKFIKGGNKNFKDSLNFLYSLEWPIEQDYYGKSSETIGSKYNNSFVKIENEYIVFLKTSVICQDSSKIFYNLIPIGLDSQVYTVYPVVNGKVFDPKNDFGFGTNITVSEYINKITENINKIISIEY